VTVVAKASGVGRAGKGWEGLGRAGMSVRVRMFAALREAAGEGETTVDPAPLPVVLDALRARYGEPFTSRLALCSILLDGSSVPRGDPRDVPDGAELALLPPVGGGGLPSGAVPAAALVAAMLVVAFLGGLLAGPVSFAAVVIVLAALVLLDTCSVLAAAAARPVLPAALVPAVALPVSLAFDSDGGWQRMPAYVAVAVIGAFTLVLLTGRRRGVSAGLGATMLAGLLVGLGSAGVLLLRALPKGEAWTVGLLGLAAAADIFLALSLGGTRWAASGSTRERSGPRAAAAALGVTVVGAALWVLLRAAIPVLSVLLLGVVALAGAMAGRALQWRLEAEQSPSRLARRPPRGPRAGVLLGVVDGVLLASPLAHLLALATAP
jgi:molybdopterin converting factor small subunit